MSAQLQENRPALNWLESPTDPRRPPGASLQPWLTYAGLLTVRMKKLCAHGFRLELLDDDAGPGLMLDEPWLRRVVLWCGDVPCVYAESHLPRPTLESIPGLKNLGSDPLGETLQATVGVSRGPFEYALLLDPALPKTVQSASAATLWARRSAFTVGNASLVVAEAFLPGISALQPPG